MSTDNRDSAAGLGPYLRRFALLVLLLIASRGVLGGVYEFVSDVNWLAGISVVVLASVLPLWLFLRYEDSQYGE